MWPFISNWPYRIASKCVLYEKMVRWKKIYKNNFGLSYFLTSTFNADTKVKRRGRWDHFYDLDFLSIRIISSSTSFFSVYIDCQCVLGLYFCRLWLNVISSFLSHKCRLNLRQMANCLTSESLTSKLRPNSTR